MQSIIIRNPVAVIMLWSGVYSTSKVAPNIPKRRHSLERLPCPAQNSTKSCKVERLTLRSIQHLATSICSICANATPLNSGKAFCNILMVTNAPSLSPYCPRSGSQPAKADDLFSDKERR